MITVLCLNLATDLCIFSLLIPVRIVSPVWLQGSPRLNGAYV